MAIRSPQWKPQEQKKGPVRGGPGARSRDSSRDPCMGDRALPKTRHPGYWLLSDTRIKPGLQVAAHKSSSPPQRLIPHTESPETYLPSSHCQMFLSGSYLGFSRFFAGNNLASCFPWEPDSFQEVEAVKMMKSIP